jgi:serpin B
VSEPVDPSRAHLRFSLALHRVIAADGGDSCFSPYSVAGALNLLTRAARGVTADELRALPGGHVDQSDLLAAAAELTAPEGREAPVLEVANTLWAWEELPLERDFLDELAGTSHGTAATAPFVSDPDGARRLINAEVAATTRDLIPELLAPEAIGPDTVACLVSALYLKLAWLLPFRAARTELADFHAPDGTVQVPTMRQSESLGYAAADGWQAVALPAVGGVQAVVLLPDGDLAEREPGLDDAVLARLLDTASTPVNLALPKVSLDVRSGLTEALRTLGVRTLFTSAADLGGLTQDPRAAVSDVVHQAVLRLDEQGLEGAAATAVTMRLTAAPVADPVTVQVDRPFLLLVRHGGSGAIYFLARVVHP